MLSDEYFIDFVSHHCLEDTRIWDNDACLQRERLLHLFLVYTTLLPS